MRNLKTRLAIVFLIFAFFFGSVSAALWVGNQMFNFVQRTEFDAEIGNSKFNIVRWEINIWWDEFKDFVTFWDNGPGGTDKEKSQLVLHYFELLEKENWLETQYEQNPNDFLVFEELKSVRIERGNIEGDVEKILAGQIKKVLMDEGIYNPWNKTHIFFPPVKFRLEEPPKVLVLSYREEIKVKQRILIKSDTPLEEIERIEDEIEKLGYSALIVPTSGIASYPSMIVPESLKNTIEIITHEWTHQYLAFRPLGFKYFRWIITGDGNQDIISLNETVADIVGKEIAKKVYEKYYPSIRDANSGQVLPPATAPRSGIDFYAEMQEIRKTVEEYLAEGKIEEAENYMKEKRDWFEKNGYYIRKLTQAYFAFYGFYGASPAYQDAHGGIGEKIIELREQSSSLKEFLGKTSKITNREGLGKLLTE